MKNTILILSLSILSLSTTAIPILFSNDNTQQNHNIINAMDNEGLQSPNLCHGSFVKGALVHEYSSSKSGSVDVCDFYKPTKISGKDTNPFRNPYSKGVIKYNDFGYAASLSRMPLGYMMLSYNYADKHHYSQANILGSMISYLVHWAGGAMTPYADGLCLTKDFYKDVDHYEMEGFYKNMASINLYKFVTFIQSVD